uniref:Uncharacterized protein n=2 Tax=Cyprinus carpio TaxID=7962 RepID=A0A9R1SBW1_CYPCA
PCFPGPSPPMESSESCLAQDGPSVHMLMTRKTSQTCSNQSELVFLIPNFLFFHISSREEKSHHPLEELVHELNGEDKRCKSGRKCNWPAIKKNYK